MSARLPSAADFFGLGAPWTGAVYPDPYVFAPASPLSVTGLVFHHGATATGPYEAVVAFSSRFEAGYFFFGWNPGGNFLGDFGSGGAGFVTNPPIDTWIVFGLSMDPVGATTLRWKLLGESAWDVNKTVTWSANRPAFDVRRFFLGYSEFGDSAGKLSFSNVRAWRAALTSVELLAEAQSASMVRSANAYAWWKMKPGALAVDSLGLHNLLTFGAPINGADSPLEAPSDSSGGTAVVVGVQMNSAVGAVTGHGAGRASVAGITVNSTTGVVSGHGAGRIAVVGLERSFFVGAPVGRGGARASALGVGLLTEIGLISVRSGVHVRVVGVDIFTSIGYVPQVVPLVPEIPEIVDRGLGVDDPNEFGRPAGLARWAGARGFAQLTAGSKMVGGRSQLRQPGHKWP